MYRLKQSYKIWRNNNFMSWEGFAGLRPCVPRKTVLMLLRRRQRFVHNALYRVLFYGLGLWEKNKQAKMARP